MMPSISECYEQVLALIGLTLTAGLGRIVYIIGLVRRGERRFWSWNLMWELPVAIFMGLIGLGLAEWLQVADRWQETAIIAACGYLGPRGFESWIERALVSRRDG